MDMLDHARTRRTTGIMLVLLLGAIGASPATLAQQPAGSPAASPGPGPGRLGANVEVYRDDFSEPSGWEVVDDEVGRTAYDDGGLVMLVAEDGSTLWDDHQLPEPHAVLRVEALVDGLDGAGAAGVACGSSLGLPRWLYAAVTDEADWIFGRIIDTRLQVIQRAPLPDTVDAGHVRVGIECAASPDEGGDHVLVTLDGVTATLPAFDIPVGPYDKATLLVAADLAPLAVRFDDLLVHAGEAYQPREIERDSTRPSTG